MRFIVLINEKPYELEAKDQEEAFDKVVKYCHDESIMNGSQEMVRAWAEHSGDVGLYSADEIETIGDITPEIQKPEFKKDVSALIDGSCLEAQATEEAEMGLPWDPMED